MLPAREELLSILQMELGQEILIQFDGTISQSQFRKFDKFLTLVLGRFYILNETVRDKFLRRR